MTKEIKQPDHISSTANLSPDTNTFPPTKINYTHRVSGLRKAAAVSIGMLSLGTPGVITPPSVDAYTGGIKTTAASDKSGLTPEASPSLDPETERDEIDQRLDAWLDGSFRTDLKIDEFFTNRRHDYIPLNITDPNIINFPEDYSQAVVPFQGVLLARETVPSDAGPEYDIYYFGIEGKNRQRMFVGVNVGRAAEDSITTTGYAYKETPNKSGDKYVNTLKLRDTLAGKEGQVMLFLPSAAEGQRTIDPDLKERMDCVIPQQEFADAFIRAMAAVVTDGIEINDLPDDNPVKGYINERITKYVPETTLFSIGITEMRPEE